MIHAVIIVSRTTALKPRFRGLQCPGSSPALQSHLKANFADRFLKHAYGRVIDEEGLVGQMKADILTLVIVDMHRNFVNQVDRLAIGRF